MPKILHPISLKAAFTSLWRHRDLIGQLTRRTILEKYQGSLLGAFWAVLNPLIMLGIYTLVFGVIFADRGYKATGGPLEFAPFIFAGLIVANFFSECLQTSCGTIVSRPNYVKKMVFPLEILPWTVVGAALFQALSNIVILSVFHAAFTGKIFMTILLLPLLYLPFILLTMGLCWFLSCLGVYVRDIGQSIGLLTAAMLFLSPTFYSITTVPESFRGFLYFNPLTFIILQSRELLLYGQGMDWVGWGIYCMISLIVFWLGFIFFQLLRKGFSDVL